MNLQERIRLWEEEEQIAYIHGWDFSHIDDRMTEQNDYPWDYRETVLRHLSPEKKLLDTDTGGGEFLLALGHPHENTAATEGYPPNMELCRQTLCPFGIDFREGAIYDGLPYADASFDVIINRHGDLNPADFWRMLKPGGVFITQQVGAENDRELVQMLCGDVPMPFPEQYLQKAEEKFRQTGFEILEGQECYRTIAFTDVAALVWFARIIQWEFPDFSVETHRENLIQAQAILEREGILRGKTHRFFLVARKPEK